MISKFEKEAKQFIVKKKKEGKKPSKNSNISLNRRSLKIGYRDIAISLVQPTLALDNMDDLGQYLPYKHLIEIQISQRPLDEVNTVLHELLHVLVSDMGETQKGGALSDSDDEERFVLSLANALTQVFRDNKWLLAYMQNKFNE